MASKENLRQTSYCGLYCKECVFGKGTAADLARDLRKEMRTSRLDKVAEIIPIPEFKKYDDAYEFLGLMVKMRCKGCRGGSRSKFCNIAQCAIGKEVAGCWECGEFETCEKLDFLVPVHGEAHKKNLRKLKRAGVDEWIAGGPAWYASPRKK